MKLTASQFFEKKNKIGKIQPDSSRTKKIRSELKEKLQPAPQEYKRS